jgi:hypothetical protein
VRVYTDAYDGALRVRIGEERLGSASLGPWFGGTGAVRLIQIHKTWFWAYRLDAHAPRGTSRLPEAEFGRVLEHLPSARILRGTPRSLDVEVSEADLAVLRSQVVPLSTRVARLGAGDGRVGSVASVMAMFGDFDLALSGRAARVLFHLDGRRFLAFRLIGGRVQGGLNEGDMAAVAAHVPSARLLREGERSLVEVDDADFAALQAMAQEA